MATSFKDFLAQLEAEARKEGPEAEAQMQALHENFHAGLEAAQAKIKRRREWSLTVCAALCTVITNLVLLFVIPGFGALRWYFSLPLFTAIYLLWVYALIPGLINLKRRIVQ